MNINTRHSPLQSDDLLSVCPDCGAPRELTIIEDEDANGASIFVVRSCTQDKSHQQFSVGATNRDLRDANHDNETR